MAKNLLIVESPAKAKTIEKILGKDFSVKSSYGHVRDLPKGNISVDIEHDFEPSYIITPDKKKLVSELKAAVKQAETVWLATDEDREGEAISWHLCKVLGLDETITKRIVFHEITEPAIKQAVQNPRLLDLHLVDAQQARRILDRLVGYELSELLWKKIKGKLSAGRVQSVAVRLVVEREREILQFKVVPFFKITAEFNVDNQQGKTVVLVAESPTRFDSEAGATTFLKNCTGADFSIEDIQVKPAKRNPAAPFTTSTLQQEASRKLGFAVRRTMLVAQKLYEAGHITYMRTDSINLSKVAIGAIAHEIESLFGKEYLQIRTFKSKANAQEAHEAIRPTYIQNQTIPGDRDQQRLYELIWKRTIACQMAEALLERTIVKIDISSHPGAGLQAEGEVLKFDGFLKVYLESTDDDDDDENTKGMLPPLKVGQHLNLRQLMATERFTRPPGRYTEASLVSKLEELGIGRPSTYAPTITKIMEENRGYVVKESRDGEHREFVIHTLKDGVIKKSMSSEITGAAKNRLFPTDMGMVVTDFLYENFADILDFGFTAGIEKQFDEIADGKMKWPKMVGNFYSPFHENVVRTLETSARATGERELGIDPDSGRTVLVRMTRYGKPAAQIGKKEELGEDEKPKFANLNPSQTIETITLEEALKLFSLPKDLGEYLSQSVSIGIGRFGPYVRHGEAFVSIPKTQDPMEVNLEMAIELIKEKQKSDAPIGTYKGLPISQGKGRFGPFLKWNGIFVNIPRKYNPDALTLDQAYELIEAKVDKEANRYIHKWDKEGIAVENGRWGPFIRFKKKNVTFPKIDGQRVTKESAAGMTLADVKKIIEAALPGSFKK